MFFLYGNCFIFIIELFVFFVLKKSCRWAFCTKMHTLTEWLLRARDCLKWKGIPDQNVGWFLSLLHIVSFKLSASFRLKFNIWVKLCFETLSHSNLFSKMAFQENFTWFSNNLNLYFNLNLNVREKYQIESSYNCSSWCVFKNFNYHFIDA